MKIYVDEDRMLRSADDILTIKAELAHQMDEIEFLVLNLPDSWQGDAERALASKIIFVRQQYMQLDGFFEAYAQTVKQFASEYTDFDNNTGLKINLT